MQFVDVGTLAGAEAEMMQADALLLERCAGVLGRRCADPDCRPSSHTVIRRLGIDHGLQPEKRQQFAIELARAFEIRGGQKDGRDIRLAGIEPVAYDAANSRAALSALIAGRDVTLRGEDDTPDRYGRQPAFVFLDGAGNSVQATLLGQGEALVSANVTDKDCAAALFAAEAGARDAKSGIWAGPAVIKNAESPGDILAGNGRFMLVEGRVLSVRRAGATTYLNFGRNWTRDFAVTISRRVLPSLEAAGIAPKSLDNRRIRVRG